MSSIRTRVRKDGTSYHSILFRHHGTQSSRSFEDYREALKFKDLLDRVGPDRALDIIDAIHGVSQTGVPTLREAIDDHIGALTGVEKGTKLRYRRYLENDVATFQGMADLPITAIDAKLLGCWVTHLEEDRGNAPKTIANKASFVSGVLKGLAAKGIIPGNPCAAVRLPRVDPAEMTFLEQDEFAAIVKVIPEQWRPLTMFLAASGSRFGEASALTVGDIDMKAGTVRINKAWKYTGGRRHLGRPKTKKGNRTINLDADLIALLPLGRPRDKLLFEHTEQQVEVTWYYRNIWTKAVTRLSSEKGDPLNGKRPRIHDLRHTCASWMLCDNIPLHVVQAHLGHESIKTTSDRYGHLDRRSGSAAAAAVGAKLPIPRKPELAVVDGAVA
ncbi:site-specific integrase [Nocardia sp. CNY236]|uniref:tyrosine-type recombinase/integrase n=1 Tax=Nocardia sp. CNY236 TaxID=1169152 RepID=UPI0003FEDADE|nr:site-specific integrase [Nocardia sp. CNY236]